MSRTPRTLQADKLPLGRKSLGQSEHEDHVELDRLLKLAIRYLENMDLPGANEALKQASAKAVTIRDEAISEADTTE